MIVADTDVLIDFLRGRNPAADRVALESRGKGIGMADYLIAGTCVAKRAILLTKNRKHFERVPGLSLATMSSP